MSWVCFFRPNLACLVLLSLVFWDCIHLFDGIHGFGLLQLLLPLFDVFTDINYIIIIFLLSVCACSCVRVCMLASSVISAIELSDLL